MVRLLLYSCYSYGLLQESHLSTSIGMNPSHQCKYRVTHMPYQWQKYQIIPSDSIDINNDRPPYLTCRGGTFCRRTCHMLYKRNEGHLKMEELVRPTTCSDLTNRYYPLDALIQRIAMRLGRQRRWLGLVEIVSAGNVPPGAVRRIIKST